MTTILVLWSVALAVALLVTVVDVYLLLRVIYLSQEIKELAARTLPAAAGIVRNTSAAGPLTDTAKGVGAVAEKVVLTERLVALLATKLAGGRS